MTKGDKFGFAYVGVMSLYFLVSGISVLFDVPAKLARIGLSAVDADGQIAFILIYCSLMVGIGVACLIIAFLSKSWVYSAVLATTIIVSFITFRLIGSVMAGGISETQVNFIVIEILEVALGGYLLLKYGFPAKKPGN